MNGLNAKTVLAPAAVLLVICILVSAALAGTNLLTRDRIAEAAAQKAEESRMVVLPGAESFEERDGHYVGLDGSGNSVGYVFETEGKGYGGSVNVMTGISTDGSITGVVLLSHGETPGLGANAEKESFRDQYKGQPAACGRYQCSEVPDPQGRGDPGHDRGHHYQHRGYKRGERGHRAVPERLPVRGR